MNLLVGSIIMRQALKSDQVQSESERQARIAEEARLAQIRKKKNQQKIAQQIKKTSVGQSLGGSRLLKQSKYLKKWNMRYVSLSTECIFTFKLRGEINHSVWHTEQIPLKTICKLEKLQDLTKQQFCFPFSIQGEDKHGKLQSFVFRCPTEQIRKGWISQIKKNSRKLN